MQPRVPELDVSRIRVDAEPAPYILDVREDHEWAAGHIEDAHHIPLMTVPQRMEEIPADHEVLVVCRVGNRSSQAVAFLRQYGIDAVNITGGMSAWAAAGRPMVSSTKGHPHVF